MDKYFDIIKSIVVGAIPLIVFFAIVVFTYPAITQAYNETLAIASTLALAAFVFYNYYVKPFNKN